MRRPVTITLTVALDEDAWQKWVRRVLDDCAPDETASPALDLGRALACQLGPAPFTYLEGAPGVEVLTLNDARAEAPYDEDEVEF
jgi:hypothetical protein